jgi:hypothetical protein
VPSPWATLWEAPDPGSSPPCCISSRSASTAWQPFVMVAEPLPLSLCRGLMVFETFFKKLKEKNDLKKVNRLLRKTHTHRERERGGGGGGLCIVKVAHIYCCCWHGIGICIAWQGITRHGMDRKKKGHVCRKKFRIQAPLSPKTNDLAVAVILTMTRRTS